MIERHTVQRWLEEAGVAVEPIEIENPEEYRWYLGCRGGPFLTLIAHRDVPWNALEMQIALAVADEHQARIRDFAADLRGRFVFDLRIDCTHRPVGFQIELTDDGVPARVAFQTNIFEERVEKAGFLRRNLQLQHAAMGAALMIQRFVHFGEAGGVR